MNESSGSAVHLAGWLVADLMILLMVVGLSSLGGLKAPTDRRPPTTTTTSTTSTTAVASPQTSMPPDKEDAPGVASSGFEPTPFCVTLLPGEAPNEVVAAALSVGNAVDRTAGMVLTFGLDQDSGAGSSLASAINSELVQLPGFDRAVTRDFWSARSPAGGANIEIYFLAGPDELPPTQCPWLNP